MELPIELVCKIVAEFGLWDVEQLMILRLVCSEFKDAADSVLFDRVTIYPSYKSIAKATNTINHFHCTITEIVLVPSPFATGALDEDQLKSNPGEYLNTLHDQYQKVKDISQDVIDSGALAKFFTMAVQKLPHLRKIILSGYEWEPRFEQYSLKYLVEEKVGSCSLDLCPWHAPSMPAPPIPAPMSSILGWRKRSFDQVLIPFATALAHSETCIQEIDTIYAAGEALLSQSALTCLLARSFVDLSKLNLILSPSVLIKPKEISDDELANNQENIKKAMSALRQLTELSLRTDKRLDESMDELLEVGLSPPAPTGVLEQCYLPKLKKLSLEDYYATERELCHIAEACPWLVDLSIIGCSLQARSWYAVVESLRNHPTLRKVNLRCPKMSGLEHVRQYDIPGKVREYLFGDGHNSLQGGLDQWTKPQEMFIVEWNSDGLVGASMDNF